MKSTGEVLGIAHNYHDALLKGLIGAGYTFKTPGPASCCIFTVKDSDKPEFVDIAWKLKSMGYKLYGTSGTCAWLNKHMVPCNEVRNISGEAPNIVDLLQSGLVDYVFSTSAGGTVELVAHILQLPCNIHELGLSLSFTVKMQQLPGPGVLKV